MGGKSSSQGAPTAPPQAAPPTAAAAVPALLLSDGATKDVSSSSRLRVEDAWQIAMAWHKPLQNKVRLVTALDGPRTGIVDSYAWVHFPALPLDDHRAISIARAAALTWLALSKCPGYSGRENPVFWRCVFSAHWTKQSTSRLGIRSVYEYDIQSVNDSIGFFDQHGHEFPRFMLDADSLEEGDAHAAGVRQFCGSPSEELPNAETQTKLDKILARMERFVTTQQQHRRAVVDVCLACLQTHGFASLHEYLAKREPRPNDPRQPLSAVLQRLLPEVNEDSTTTPQFRVIHLQSAGSFVIRNDADVDKLYELLQRETVTLGGFDCWVMTVRQLSPTARATLVGGLLALPGHAIRVTTKSLFLKSLYNPVFPALVSALPFANSVHTIQLSSSASEKEFNTLDLPWLAYAMFHPDAATSSSWKCLVLENTVLDDTSARVLAAMARGNNLVALLNGETTPRSSAYYSARLARGTAIMAGASDDAQVLFVDHGTHDDDRRVDVCGIFSLNPATWTAWVAVVVPAYGLGYVRSQHLQDVQARAPSPCPLVGLTIRRRDTYLHQDAEVVRAFVTALGPSRLQFLDIGEYCVFESASLLRQLLEQCPSLTSLAVAHSGTLWREGDSALRSRPRLRQLELSIAAPQKRLETPSLYHLQSTLSQLEVLRVRPGSDDQYKASQRAIKVVLSQSKTLRHFHWQRGLLFVKEWRLPVAYPQVRAWTTQLLGEIKWKDTTHLFVDATFSSSSVAAFLSVVTNTSSTCARKHATAPPPRVVLDRDVVTKILQFVHSCHARRVITVEPKSSWISDDPSKQASGG